MMSRAFTTREKILMLVLAALLLGILYYQVLIKGVNETIAEYDTTDLETDLIIEQSKNTGIQTMKAEMGQGKTTTGLVASYNNIKNEIKSLNDIFAPASTYNFDFNQAIKDGDAVRRDINVSFTATSYSRAESIIKDLYNCKYRCIIRSINMSTIGDSGISSGSVSVNMVVTFFETMYNADTTDGLGEEKDNEGDTTAKTE